MQNVLKFHNTNTFAPNHEGLTSKNSSEDLKKEREGAK